VENPRDMAKFEWQTNTVPIYLHEQKIEKKMSLGNCTLLLSNFVHYQSNSRSSTDPELP
jgi:hypothetical protein